MSSVGSCLCCIIPNIKMQNINIRTRGKFLKKTTEELFAIVITSVQKAFHVSQRKGWPDRKFNVLVAHEAGHACYVRTQGIQVSFPLYPSSFTRVLAAGVEVSRDKQRSHFFGSVYYARCVARSS